MSGQEALSLAFHGAARGVTGSRFLLQAGNDRILVDCGQFQGGRDERQLNWQDPGFDPRSIDAVLVTHAHLDHCGYLPRLSRLGFQGPVICTRPTAKLIPIVLRDAAMLEEEDAEYANRKGYSRHRPALPMFTRDDAESVIRRLDGIPVHKETAIGGFRFRFNHAGHILGAATIELGHQQIPNRLVFSGDLGRPGVPLHVDPDPRPPCDTLILESTYGDRSHHPETMEAELLAAIEPTLRRGGIVLLPAFAVARAQLLAQLLESLMADGKLPPVPVHIDSPMAVNVTEVYEDFENTLELDPPPPPNPGIPATRVHRTRDESKSLVGIPGPAVIIASSGMLAGGRVLHHLRWVAPKRENAIILTGYQAAGTRGALLLGGIRELRIHGQLVPIAAKVLNLKSLSAHADQSQLAGWALTPPAPGTIFLVHGEEEASATLGERLASTVTTVHRPTLHQTFTTTGAGWEPA